MTPMQLQYVKLSKDLYKFFYESGDSYGEFYIRLKPETDARGSATLEAKDPDYAKDLLDGLSIALIKEGYGR